MNNPLSLFEQPIDTKQMQRLDDRAETPIESSDIWYLHMTLCQCFLPYQDPTTDEWQRTNGDFSIALVAGHLRDPESDQPLRRVGLPYGPKPLCAAIISLPPSHRLRFQPVFVVQTTKDGMGHSPQMAGSRGRWRPRIAWPQDPCVQDVS